MLPNNGSVTLLGNLEVIEKYNLETNAKLISIRFSRIKQTRILLLSQALDLFAKKEDRYFHSFFNDCVYY